MEYKVGIVGATGLVGETFLKILEERKSPVGSLRLYASEASRGKRVSFRETAVELETLSEGCFKGLDFVFFSSGDEISRIWAPQAVQSGAYAIDNSAAFRMDPKIPLIVPEVNGNLIPRTPQIIANPNCSTIQLVVVLKPLLDQFGLESVQVASYQSVSGAGKEGIEELQRQLQDELQGREVTPFTFPATIAYNCVPQIGSFDSQGLCSEEQKIRNETRKILDQPELPVSPFTVRVPSAHCHAEVAWIKLKKNVETTDLLSVLKRAPGVVLSSETKAPPYFTPREMKNCNDTYVSRIHRDLDDSKCWIMWIVADNLRKGAAYNGLQIMEALF